MKYSLIGLDSNCFMILGYVKKAMKKENYSKEEIDEYVREIREIEVNRTLYHLSGSMGEDTLCGIAFVDAEEDFEVQEGKEGTLQDVTCPKCLATAKYIRSIDERDKK